MPTKYGNGVQVHSKKQMRVQIMVIKCVSNESLACPLIQYLIKFYDTVH